MNNIGTFAFCGCSSLSRIILINGLTILGESMFDMSYSSLSILTLTNVVIPSTLISIG